MQQSKLNVYEKRERIDKIVGKTLSFCNIKANYNVIIDDDVITDNYNFNITINFDYFDESFMNYFKLVKYNLTKEFAIYSNEYVFKTLMRYFVDEVLNFFFKKEDIDRYRNIIKINSFVIDNVNKKIEDTSHLFY